MQPQYHPGWCAQLRRQPSRMDHSYRGLLSIPSRYAATIWAPSDYRPHWLGNETSAPLCAGVYCRRVQYAGSISGAPRPSLRRTDQVQAATTPVAWLHFCQSAMPPKQAMLVQFGRRGEVRGCAETVHTKVSPSCRKVTDYRPLHTSTPLP